jgi:DNA-binding IclR family transcriptional regulator
VNCFEQNRECGATDLATKIGVDRSTAYRLAQALVDVGWLRQDASTKKYQLDIRLWEIGTLAIADVDMRKAAYPHMLELSAATGESSDLAILHGYDMVYIERVEGNHGVRVYSRIGMRVPAHAIAMGKVLLAHLPKERRLKHLPKLLRRYTDRTVTNLAELNRQCNRALTDGYAVNFGEWRADAGGIAAPVFDRSGCCIAAVSIDLPLSRLRQDTVKELAPLVRRASTRISRQNGAAPAVMLALN